MLQRLAHKRPREDVSKAAEVHGQREEARAEPMAAACRDGGGAEHLHDRERDQKPQVAVRDGPAGGDASVESAVEPDGGGGP